MTISGIEVKACAHVFLLFVMYASVGVLEIAKVFCAPKKISFVLCSRRMTSVLKKCATRKNELEREECEEKSVKGGNKERKRGKERWRERGEEGREREKE